MTELSAVHPTPAEPIPSAQALLGDRLGTVLDGGLAAVPFEVIKRLLLQPTLLLQLQELVLEQGSDYWDRIAPLTPNLDNRVERGRLRLELAIDAPRPKVAWYRRPWLVSLATAASILLAVVVYDTFRNPVGGPGRRCPSRLGLESE